ncbi:MAG: EamA family transporter RarD [Nocardiopsaceae bacterium]|nr:EamA family transporter RarD [Nocardiopsaceae bacterium]
MSDYNRGLLFGASAYLMWGFTTLYWPLLSSAGATEILAHRMMWSLLVVLALLAARRHWRWLFDVLRSPRQLLVLAGAAAVIAVNWGVFIYTINSGQASQAALGYFINPLVSVTLGVFIFAEKLRRAQWAAVALGALAVVVLTYAYGAPPWLSLGIAFTFTVYGVLKKFSRLDGLESLTIETLLLFLPAFGYVVYLQATGNGTFTQVSTAHSLLLVGTGVVTALPLLCFGAAAHRVPLSMIGLLQFAVPVMQFLFAWLVFAEELPPSRWAGFAIVWVALAVFAVDMVRSSRTPGNGGTAPDRKRPRAIQEAGGRPS